MSRVVLGLAYAAAGAALALALFWPPAAIVAVVLAIGLTLELLSHRFNREPRR